MHLLFSKNVLIFDYSSVELSSIFNTRGSRNFGFIYNLCIQNEMLVYNKDDKLIRKIYILSGHIIRELGLTQTGYLICYIYRRSKVFYLLKTFVSSFTEPSFYYEYHSQLQSVLGLFLRRQTLFLLQIVYEYHSLSFLYFPSIVFFQVIYTCVSVCMLGLLYGLTKGDKEYWKFSKSLTIV